MIIPWQQINDDTLTNLLESYALREGTDYGEYECPLEQKVAELRQQLEKGDIVVVYSELHESVTLMPTQVFNAQHTTAKD
ncbi:YheU family protein [Celerinatantimonas sp. YJH-8]|uniref:YheU family protein n=1 Tax=Celerinatantimonas sp. YJH-8 TaxID=3228714 RepID=UPI0038CA007F